MYFVSATFLISATSVIFSAPWNIVPSFVTENFLNYVSNSKVQLLGWILQFVINWIVWASTMDFSSTNTAINILMINYSLVSMLVFFIRYSLTNIQNYVNKIINTL